MDKIVCWRFLSSYFFAGLMCACLAPFAWGLPPVKIGILMDLSGPASSLSNSMVASAQLAISEVSNSKSFMGGRRIEGLVDDSTCTNADAAINAAERLASAGVKGIVGALCSGSSIAVLQNVAMVNQLPMISPSSSSPALSNLLDDHLFSRTAPSDTKQAEAMARLLWTKGFKKIAITYINNDYGYGTASTIADTFIKLGGLVSIVDSHEDGKQDYRAEISQLELAGGDVLVIVGYANGGGRHIAKGVLSRKDIFERVVLADAMLSDEFFLELGGLLNGSIGFGPLSRESRVGYGRFEKIANHYGITVGPYAPEAYDAAAIMLLAMQASESVEGHIYKHSIASITNPPGIKIFPGELTKALKLLMQGQEIDYQGATEVDLNALGEPDGLYEEIVLYAGKSNIIKRWVGGLNKSSIKVMTPTEQAADTRIGVSQNQLFDDVNVQDLIENEELERLRSEVITLRREKEQRVKKIATDKENPVIRITYASSVDAKGVISGVATDNTGVAEIRVDGEIVPTDGSGGFSVNIFVPIEGKSVEVVAIDLKGLSSIETVRLERTKRTQQVSRLAAVNPLVGPKQKSSRDRAALIIGLEQYAAAPPADYASRDAQMFADYAREKLGIAPGNIKVFTDTEATRSGLLRALKVWLPQAIQPDKTDLYVFYAGHGMASDDGESAYIVPYGADTFLLEDTAISRERFYEEIGAAKPRTATFFFDNCYAGTTRSEERLLAQRPLSIKVQESSVPDNYLVFTAGESDQTAGVLDEVKHGRFSYFVFKGLEGEADANQDGKISAGELHTYVRESVGRFSAGAQTPTMLGDADRWVLR